MTIHITDKIPLNQMVKFHEVLCTTGGRYLSNPQKIGNNYLVNYEAGDYKLHNKLWTDYTTTIKEVRKDQSWRCWLRRLLGWFSFKGTKL